MWRIRGISCRPTAVTFIDILWTVPAIPVGYEPSPIKGSCSERGSSFCVYAQPHAEEVCRRSGIWGRGEKGNMALPCSILCIGSLHNLSVLFIR